MKKLALRFSFIWVMFSFMSWAASAKTSIKDFESAKFSLVTLGPSHYLYSSAGHTLIRVTTNEFDHVFNWGIFKFDDKFAWKFFQGNTHYSVLATSAKRYFTRGKKILPRSIIQDELLLSTEQKEKLWNKIIWWLKKENRYYQYHPWKRNCTTIVRDIINHALNNQVKQKLSAKESYLSVRDTWHLYFGEWTFLATLVDIAFNSTTDQALSSWEVMHAPELLRLGLMEFQAYAPNGSELAEKKLLNNASTIEKGSFWSYRYKNRYFLLLLVFLLPILLAFLPFIKTSGRAFRLLVGIPSALWGLSSGLLGLLLLCMPLLSYRSYLYYSANLWIMWPLDLCLIVTGIFWVLGKTTLPKFLLYTQKYTSYAHMGACLIFLFLAIFQFFDQEIYHSLTVLMPISLLINLLQLVLIQQAESQIKSSGDESSSKLRKEAKRQQRKMSA